MIQVADLLENIDQTSDTMMPTVLKSLKVGASELFKNAVSFF